jgi:hypothetical protein
MVLTCAFRGLGFANHDVVQAHFAFQVGRAFDPEYESRCVVGPIALEFKPEVPPIRRRLM